MRNIAFGLAQEGGEAADKFFDALTNDSGSDGLDVLYDIARFRHGTKAGKEGHRYPAPPGGRWPAPRLRSRSSSISAKPRARPSAISLRKWSSRETIGLSSSCKCFATRECSRRRDPCCYKENSALGAAMHSLRARLGAAPAALCPGPLTSALRDGRCVGAAL